MDGLTPMYIWKELTGLRGSFFKSPGSYERVEKSRVGIGGDRGKTVTIEKKKNTLYTCMKFKVSEIFNMGTRQLFSSLHNGRFQLDHGREMTGAETNTGIQKA